MINYCYCFDDIDDDGQLYTCVEILIIGCFYMIPRVRIES